jgi:A/G-specific adenine glycosylase
MKYEIMSSAIEKWYDENKRDLPWRKKPNPYMVWLAEIVFQQTRIQQGLNHYKRILESFPKLENLAQASEDEVLKLWEGLGYYSRARNLLKGAKQISAKGNFPSKAAEWEKISGVGPYTAAAISSVCFREKIAVLDGNVMRVIARVFLIKNDIRLKSTQDKLRNLAQKFVDKSVYPGNLNQGLMEIGALICLPKNPKCQKCPLKDNCQLYTKNEAAADYPYKSPPPKKTERHIHWLIASNSKFLMLRRRNEKDVWQGLYELPQTLKPPGSIYPNAQLIHKGSHILSHQKIFYHIWDIEQWSKLSMEFQAFDIDRELPALPRPIQRFLNK